MTDLETILAFVEAQSHGNLHVATSDVGHPRVTTITVSGPLTDLGADQSAVIARLYTLESGRLLHADWPEFNRPKPPVFREQARFYQGLGRDCRAALGEGFRSLAEVCGGQAPTIGRIVHVWTTERDAAHGPLADVVQRVDDDGRVLVTSMGTWKIHYASEAEGSVYRWTWPVWVR